MIKAFELTHELAWNVMWDFFAYQGNTAIMGSRDATREAFAKGLIADGERWMEMIQSRNQASHTYNEGTAGRGDRPLGAGGLLSALRRLRHPDAGALAVPYGLTPETIAKICAVFAGYPGIRQVLIYGSRAKGNFRPGSDIDLTLDQTLVGESLTLEQLLDIEDKLDALDLPYKIDVCLFHQIDNPNLVDHIRRVGKVLC